MSNRETHIQNLISELKSYNITMREISDTSGIPVESLRVGLSRGLVSDDRLSQIKSAMDKIMEERFQKALKYRKEAVA